MRLIIANGLRVKSFLSHQQFFLALSQKWVSLGNEVIAFMPKGYFENYPDTYGLVEFVDWKGKKTWRRLLQECKGRNNTIITSHNVRFMSKNWVPVHKKAKIIATLRSGIAFYKNPSKIKLLIKFIARHLGFFPDHIIGVSDYITTGIQRVTGFPGEVMHTIYNGITFHEPFDLPANMGHYDENNPFLLLGVGRLHFDKGWLEFLDVLERLADNNIPFRFDLAGHGISSYEAKLRDRISMMGLENRVRLLGHVMPVHPLRRNCHIIVCPSNREAFGLAALEGMAAKRPILASDIDGMPEVIRDKENGFLLPSPKMGSRAIDQWVDKIVYLAKNPKIIQEMATSAQERSRLFSRDIQIDNYISLFHKVLGGIG